MGKGEEEEGTKVKLGGPDKKALGTSAPNEIQKYAGYRRNQL